MKLSQNQTLTFTLITALFLLFSSSQKSEASGWVGNSPMLSAFNDASFALIAASMKESDFAIKEDSPLLLKKGESRLTLGFVHDEPLKTQPLLGFDYGLTDNITWLNITALGFKLPSYNRHHFSLNVGIIDGIDYSTFSGFSIGPGVSLLHNFSSGKWQFNNSLMINALYRSKLRALNDSHWNYAFVRLRTNINRSLGDKWALGLGLESFYGGHTQITFNEDTSANNLKAQSKTDYGILLAHPTLSLSRKLADKAVLTGSFGFHEHEALKSTPNFGSYISLSTQW